MRFEATCIYKTNTGNKRKRQNSFAIMGFWGEKYCLPRVPCDVSYWQAQISIGAWHADFAISALNVACGADKPEKNSETGTIRITARHATIAQRPSHRLVKNNNKAILRGHAQIVNQGRASLKNGELIPLDMKTQ